MGRVGNKVAGRRERTAILAWLDKNHGRRQFVAVAAAILIVAAIGAISYQSWFAEVGHDHLAVNFAGYLDEFDKRPEEAQQILLANYNGRPTTLQEAATELGYEPIVASRGLPAGCSVEKVYMLKMPCCTCAQVVCRDEDGDAFAIFEHDIDQPIWYGDRPALECVCHDKPTSVVQVGDRLAATWKNGARYITVIGASNLEEVTDFIAYFSEPNAGNG